MELTPFVGRYRAGLNNNKNPQCENRIKSSSIIKLSDGAEVEEQSEPEITHHTDSAGNLFN